MLTDYSPKALTCVIFAGGKSSRMGEDKSLMPFGNYPTMIEYQYRRLSPLFKRVVISAKERDKFDFEADVIPDSIETGIYAPTAGFVSIFNHLDDERFFVLSVDTPFVTERHIQEMAEADHPNYDALIAQSQSGAHPMCGIYHRSLQHRFETMLKEDNHRLGQLLKQSKTFYLRFEDEESFANLNHPHEYEAALKRLKTMPESL